MTAEDFEATSVWLLLDCSEYKAEKNTGHIAHTERNKFQKQILAIQDTNNNKTNSCNCEFSTSFQSHQQIELKIILYIQHMYRAREKKYQVIQSKRLPKIVKLYLHDENLYLELV